METSILICFGWFFAWVLILNAINFHIFNNRFDNLSEHIEKLEKKLDELKSEINDLKK